MRPPDRGGPDHEVRSLRVRVEGEGSPDRVLGRADKDDLEDGRLAVEGSCICAIISVVEPAGARRQARRARPAADLAPRRALAFR